VPNLFLDDIWQCVKKLNSPVFLKNIISLCLSPNYKSMKSSVKIRIVSICLLVLIASCKSTDEAKKNAKEVSKATRIVKRQQKKKQREAEKLQKMAYKEFWKKQTSQARKSIKRNRRTQMKLERARRRSGN
jgi:hypothetical protein